MIGVANINALFVTLVGHAKRLEGTEAKFLANFDGFVVVMSHSDAYISRSDDYRGYDEADNR